MGLMLNSLARFWDKGTPQKVAVVGASIGASLICACVGSVVLVSALPGSGRTSTPVGALMTSTSTIQGADTPTLIVDTPTTIETSPTIIRPTATPQPGAAVLGAPGAAFIAKLGQPNGHSTSTTLHFQTYSGSNVDGLIVSLGLNNGTPLRAYEVLASAPPSHLWSMSAARPICEQYRPTDSSLVQKVNVLDSSSALLGEDDVYRSAILASEFPAGAFLDANNNVTAPGTFDIFYLYETPNDTSRIDSCSLDLGSSQTKAP